MTNRSWASSMRLRPKTGIGWGASPCAFQPSGLNPGILSRATMADRSWAVAASARMAPFSNAGALPSASGFASRQSLSVVSALAGRPVARMASTRRARPRHAGPTQDRSKGSSLWADRPQQHTPDDRRPIRGERPESPASSPRTAGTSPWRPRGCARCARFGCQRGSAPLAPATTPKVARPLDSAPGRPRVARGDRVRLPFRRQPLLEVWTGRADRRLADRQPSGLLVGSERG